MPKTAAPPTPTAILMSEHRAIERALDCLDRIAAAAQAAGTLDRADAAGAVEFLRTFADRCHHGKEEALLFPAMEARGIPVRGGPTEVMRAEHERGRAHVRAMAAAAEAGDARAFAGEAFGFTALLREHIEKEDQVLFPLADNILSADEQEDLRAGFERVEHRDLGPGVHERMLGILDALCTRHGVAPLPRKGGCGCGGGGGGSCGG